MTQIIKDRSLRYVRDEYKLTNWVKSIKERRHVYFEAIDDIKQTLFKPLGNDPSAEAIMQTLVFVLQEDDSLTDHVFGYEGSSALTGEEMWEKVTLAAAGAMLQAYELAVQKREWPVGSAQ